MKVYSRSSYRDHYLESLAKVNMGDEEESSMACFVSNGSWRHDQYTWASSSNGS